MSKEITFWWKRAKLLEDHLKKTIKENTIMLNYRTCEHEWEPDTSMIVMRCDRCGIGLNTFEALEHITELNTTF